MKPANSAIALLRRYGAIYTFVMSVIDIKSPKSLEKPDRCKSDIQDPKKPSIQLS